MTEAPAIVHLLRPYSGWRCGGIENAQAWIEELAARRGGRFGTLTARRPRRDQELVGGSVYWVAGGVTRFRMPFAALDQRGAKCWILMRLEYIPVAAIRVARLRGWRYLEAAAAPMDMALPADVPADIDSVLSDLGVV